MNGQGLCPKQFVVYRTILVVGKALTDQIRIWIFYPKGQRIGFGFVTLIIQIDVPKSEQIWMPSSNLGISSLLALCMGCVSVWCAYFLFSFTSIGFISHVGSRQVS